MPMRTATIKINGIAPLLQNNPQCVDRFNQYARQIKRINDKKTRRTDDDYIELGDLEVESKLYFDDSLGVYIPTTWLSAAIANNGFRVAKISKANIRGAVFMAEDKAKLSYHGDKGVKTAQDVIGDPEFRIKLKLPQQNVRICKAFPVFHQWNFSTSIEFDDKIIDPDSLTRIIEHAARYGGFGDFRPTFGRALAEVTHD